MTIDIGGVRIGPGQPPAVIAELSGNHNGSLDRALETIDAIAASGCRIVKLQTYTPDTMTLDVSDGDFYIGDPASLWHGRNLYELYKVAHTPWEWHPVLFERARARGLVAFSTPFDATAVDFLESLDVPAYKVASFENTDLALIEKVASTGKPVIISTGMATLAEIDEAVTTARRAGCRDLVLLKCTSSYPASSESSNLATLPYLSRLFQCPVGLSDHTRGIATAVASAALGAVVVEKHVTLRRADGGVDAAFSLESAELRDLLEGLDMAWHSVGEVRFGPSDEEKPSLKFRRSLYVCADLAAGTSLTADNVRAIRPGFGLAPKFLTNVIGRRVRQAVKRGTPVTWSLLD